MPDQNNVYLGNTGKEIRENRTASLFISVIVPVYNDPKGLAVTLESLISQDYHDDLYEILVVDNKSTDNTIEVAEKYKSKYTDRITILEEDNLQSSYAARNKGIKSAKGSVIAFIDADMTVAKNWLRLIANSLEKYQANYLACNVEIYMEEKSIFGLYNKMTGFLIENCVYHDNFAPTCCLVVRKNLFKEIGFFDSRLISSGDLEFGNRVHKSGYCLHYASRIVMKHPARSSLKSLLYKFFRIGKGYSQLSRFYPERYSKRNLLDLRYFLPGCPWKFRPVKDESWDRLSFNTKACFYLIDWIIRLASHVGYIYESIKERQNN